ncbi:MAG: 50S ribosomal protein L30 [Terriglobia bacterium]
MTEKSQRTIHIKWVRSGIGFTYRQKEMVRSLGLLRLNQVVARPDTAQIRGLVARIPHLVEIVGEPPVPAPWAAIPEYALKAPEAILPKPPEPEKAEGEAGAPPQAVAAVEVPAEASEGAKREEPKAPTKTKKAAKSTKALEVKGKPSKEEAKKKTKAAAAKEVKSAKAKKK